MKLGIMNIELTDAERRAFKKGQAICCLKIAAKYLRDEQFDELAIALELLLVAVRHADDPQQITATEKTKGMFV